MLILINAVFRLRLVNVTMCRGCYIIALNT